MRTFIGSESDVQLRSGAVVVAGPVYRITIVFEHARPISKIRPQCFYTVSIAVCFRVLVGFVRCFSASIQRSANSLRESSGSMTASTNPRRAAAKGLANASSYLPLQQILH